MRVVHTSARSATVQVGPHWAIARFLEIAKAASTCGNARDVNEGRYTESEELKRRCQSPTLRYMFF
jgi:hypothetical protein